MTSYFNKRKIKYAVLVEVIAGAFIASVNCDLEFVSFYLEMSDSCVGFKFSLM